MSSAQLRLCLFGSPVLTGADGAPVGGGVAEPHRLALLALLALHPKRSVSRAELTRYLWPTQPAKQASQLLNQALFAISKALGDDAIFPSAKEVRLGARVSVDALEFQSALEDGRPEDAMRVYTAPLMNGFELDDAPEFQSWAAAQRARFATAARTQRPVAEAGIEVLHDLAEPEKPEPTLDLPPTPAPAKKEHKEAELPVDFVLAEPEVRSQLEQTSEGPELRAQVPPAPDLMTNAVSSEPEQVAKDPLPELELTTNTVPSEPEPVTSPVRPDPPEPLRAVPPPPAPQEEVQWIDPEEPPQSVLEEPADVAPAPTAGVPQEKMTSGDAPPATVERAPEQKPENRPRRPLPRPPARLVVTVVILVALGAAGYMARGWIGAARGGIEAARGSISAAQGRVEAALQERDRERDRQRSIAVLPIEYSGRNQADAALAARIAEELGPMLTRSGLIVMPSAALTRGGPPYNLRVIADSLNVAHVLQGMMQKEGAQVAFRFRLVNPVDGTTRWEDTYRPKLADIQVLEEDVAVTVADRILGKPGERD